MIAVVLVADSVKRGGGCRQAVCAAVHPESGMQAQTGCALLDTQLVRTKVYTGLCSPWVGWGWRLGPRQ